MAHGHYRGAKNQDWQIEPRPSDDGDKNIEFLGTIRGKPHHNSKGEQELARALGSVEYQRAFKMADTAWIIALKLSSVLSLRSAIRLNSLSLPKKFSIR